MDPYVFGERYGYEDPDSHPDPYQNVTYPQHWKKSYDA